MFDDTDLGPTAKVVRPTRLLRVYPLNPSYGLGAFRRRIRLRAAGNEIQGVLDDNNHAMWVLLRHEHGLVSGVDGGFYRWPTTGCLGATTKLQALVGRSIVSSHDELFGDGRALSQCTHLYDLATLALARASHENGDRVWDAVVLDPQGDDGVATIALDGREIHRWTVRGTTITLADGTSCSLLGGFRRWAVDRFHGDMLEGATVLRMAAFTARARAHVTDDRAWPLAMFPERAGVCHAYGLAPSEAPQHRVGIVRDFSDELQQSPFPNGRRP